MQYLICNVNFLKAVKFSYADFYIQIYKCLRTGEANSGTYTIGLENV